MYNITWLHKHFVRNINVENQNICSEAKLGCLRELSCFAKWTRKRGPFNLPMKILPILTLLQWCLLSFIALPEAVHWAKSFFTLGDNTSFNYLIQWEHGSWFFPPVDSSSVSTCLLLQDVKQQDYLVVACGWHYWLIVWLMPKFIKAFVLQKTAYSPNELPVTHGADIDTYRPM